MRRRLPVLFLVLSLVAIVGCCCGRQNCNLGQPPPAPCDRCGAVVPATSRLVPAPFPQAPGAPLPAGQSVPLTAAGPTGPIASNVQPGLFTPAPAPGPAGVRLAAPEPAGPIPAGAVVPQAPNNPAAPGARPELLAPQSAPPASVQPTPVSPEGREATPDLPVDIPHFAIARPRVASGQQPYPDGVGWLKEHGYRTVLHVRAPGEDPAAARRLFEKHGLTYLDLEVSPRGLTRDVVDRFNRTVTSDVNMPLFVYDRDGSLAGGLWYLYFRLVEKTDDDRARTEATRLGLRQDEPGAHRDIWLAVQAFLATQAP